MDPTADERFTRLYEMHYLAVLGYCARRVDRSDAEDVSSEVFTVLWRRMESFDPDAALPWLYSVALGLIKNRRRSARRGLALTGKVRGNHVIGASPSADMLVVMNEQDGEILAALGRLREKDREVLRLSVWEEMSAKDIGLVVGCSTSAAEQRVHRAKKRLASKFSPTAQYRSNPSPLSLEEGGRR
jgi:RNA polymerase sigma factor (sigma-70 family)